MMRTPTSRACQQIAALFLWFELQHTVTLMLPFTSRVRHNVSVCACCYIRGFKSQLYDHVLLYFHMFRCQCFSVTESNAHEDIFASALLSSEFLLQRWLIITDQSVPIVNHFVSLGWEIIQYYSLLTSTGISWWYDHIVLFWILLSELKTPSKL